MNETHPRNPRQVAKLERNSGNEPLEAHEVQKGTGSRVSVRITAVRTRLLDEDNLCGKYHTDLCRYAGILPSDDPSKTSIQTTQRKAAKGEAEHVIIEIT